MSYIVKALRKLEQQRRRVTVTEMTLFRGLSERWQSESPVWRYLLVLSLIVNTGIAIWLLIFFSGARGRATEELNMQTTEPTVQIKKETVARPSQQSSTDPVVPKKITLEVKHIPKAETQARGRTKASEHHKPALSGMRSTKEDEWHAPRAVERLPQKASSADRLDMHESGAYALPKVRIWKDDKGNTHYSGAVGGE